MAGSPSQVRRVALLLSGFGVSERESRQAVFELPSAVGFAVSAYAGPLDVLLDAARDRGHELFASIPMEPAEFPQSDPGPRSLMVSANAAENQMNLAWALGRTPGVLGATAASDNAMIGERFADVAGVFDPVLEEIARRGLLYIDPRVGRAASRPDLVSRSVDVIIPDRAARAEIDARLFALERIAHERGTAVGLAGPLRAAVIDRIAAWSKTLPERGIALVSVSSLVKP